MVAHAGGVQGEERLACLVGGDWCNVSWTQVRQSMLGVSFTPLVAGSTVRAAIARVGAGSDMAGIGKLWTIQACLVYFGLFFKMVAIVTAAAIAVRTALLMCSFSIQSLRVRGLLPTRGLALSVWL